MKQSILSKIARINYRWALKTTVRYKKCLYFFSLVFLLFVNANAWADFCCTREAIFLPIQMPPEEETDCSGFIGDVVLPTLREGGISNCPIKYAHDSYEGREFLNWMVDEIGNIAGAPFDPDYQKALKAFLDGDYVWKASLTLNKIDNRVEGYWDDGYMPGSRDYQTGYIVGNWTLALALVNVHFNEVVEKGSISFSGTCFNEGPEYLRDLVRAYFNPINRTLYEYERVPTTATLEFEKEPLEAGEETTVTINLTDDWGRSPKKWQRIMVTTKEGEITNGVNCVDEEKAWAFKCGDGKVQIKYRPPEDCEDKTETFKVYNSCTWGQEWVRPMRVIDEKDIICEREIEIVDLQPSSCTVKPEKKELNGNEDMTIQLLNFVEPNGLELRPEEKVMVKVEEGQILNGAKHGDYKVFALGNGTVNVQYHAPDLCGVEKDQFSVYNVCEDKEKGTLEPDEKIADMPLRIKKVACDVSLYIKASFQWKDDSPSHHVEGIATMTVRGGMTFDQRYQTPMVKRYVPEKMSVGWSFKETLKDSAGDPSCPDLIQELSGGGSAAIPDPALREIGFLELRKFGEVLKEQDLSGFMPPEAKEQLTDQFMLVLPAAKQRLRGSARKSSICGEDNCPCKKYHDIDKEVGVGSIAIRGKIKPDGSMGGRHYWVAQGSSMRTLGFQVNEIGKQIEFEPPVLIKPEGKLINISVSWDIKTYR